MLSGVPAKIFTYREQFHTGLSGPYEYWWQVSNPDTNESETCILS